MTGVQTCALPISSGYSSAESFKSVIPYTDLFLFDIKHLDEKKHLELTGRSNRLILENFRLLAESGKDIYIRIPLIPGMNDDYDHLHQLRDFIISNKRESIKKINILPFHKTGASKYKKFNIPYRMDGVEPLDNRQIMMVKEFFMETGIPVKVGG